MSRNPGIAAEMGANAIATGIITGIVIPVLQYIAWTFLVDIPATTSLQQPPNAWIYLLLIGILPAIIFVTGLLEAAGGAGAFGIGAYFIMSLATSNLFSAPMVSMMMVLGTVVALALALTIKAG